VAVQHLPIASRVVHTCRRFKGGPALVPGLRAWRAGTPTSGRAGAAYLRPVPRGIIRTAHGPGHIYQGSASSANAVTLRDVLCQPYTEKPMTSAALRVVEMSDYAISPELFVPWEEITRYDIAAFESALNSARIERDMQLFLEANPRLLIQQINGGRNAWVIPQKRLGWEYVTDFMIAEKASTGFAWYAVELERPQAKIFTKKGDISAALNHALRQISDWRDWFSRNRDLAERPLNRSGLGLTDIDPEVEGLIIIGRDFDIDESTHERRRRLVRDRRVKIETYDWLLSQAKARWETSQNGAVKTANEVQRWRTISALTDFEVPGPVREMHFSNIDPTEHKKGPMWKPLSDWTNDIPPKFDDFIAKVDQILGRGAESKSVTYDKPSDYIILTLKDIITPSQAEKIVQVGQGSPNKYLLTALVYNA
jgi:hypothetical protein